MKLLCDHGYHFSIIREERTYRREGRNVYLRVERECDCGVVMIEEKTERYDEEVRSDVNTSKATP